MFAGLRQGRKEGIHPAKEDEGYGCYCGSGHCCCVTTDGKWVYMSCCYTEGTKKGTCEKYLIDAPPIVVIKGPVL